MVLPWFGLASGRAALLSAGRGIRGGALGGSRLRPSHRCRRAGFGDRFAQRCFQTLRHVGQALIGRDAASVAGAGETGGAGGGAAAIGGAGGCDGLARRFRSRFDRRGLLSRFDLRFHKLLVRQRTRGGGTIARRCRRPCGEFVGQRRKRVALRPRRRFGGGLERSGQFLRQRLKPRRRAPDARRLRLQRPR